MSSVFDIPLSGAIRQLRIGRNQTQVAFAQEVGVLRLQVIRWENGQKIPSLENLRRLVALGLPINYLLGEDLCNKFSVVEVAA